MTGFLAQEVEAAARETGYDFSGVNAPVNGKGLYSLRYSEFVVPLVRAVQELNLKNKCQQQLIDEQRSEIDGLNARLKEQQAISNDELAKLKVRLEEIEKLTIR